MDQSPRSVLAMDLHRACVEPTRIPELVLPAGMISDVVVSEGIEGCTCRTAGIPVMVYWHAPGARFSALRGAVFKGAKGNGGVSGSFAMQLSEWHASYRRPV